MNRLRCLLFTALVMLVAAQANADERILSFHADIRIDASGEMEVIETIRVRGEGDEIKRGIYRDFPTHYRGRYGEPIRIGFDIQSVSRDEHAEAWFTEALGNGVRVYIGRKEVLLKPGEYVYQLSYRTDQHLGFFDTYDELYWNVTGNAWAFPIDKVTATVRLPGRIPSGQIQARGYTGYHGGHGQDYRIEISGDGDARFEATRPLRTKEGLTVVVTWPKGFVREPTLFAKAVHYWVQNRHVSIFSLGLLLLLFYYVAVWIRVGRDPARGAIKPLSLPPKGYSPASMRFIRQMGYDNATFAAALINLAVKGHIIIHQNLAKEYTLIRLAGAKAALSPGEVTLLKHLFSRSGRLTLNKSNHGPISAALAAHEASLRRDFEFNYFVTNKRWFIAGLALTAFIFLVGLAFAPQIMSLTFFNKLANMALGALAATAFILFSVASVLFLIAIFVQWREFLRSPWKLSRLPLFQTFIVAACGSVTISCGLLINKLASWEFAVLVLLAAVLNYAFYQWLKAPTLAGRRLLDLIEGFCLYLADGNDLKPPGTIVNSPRLYEAYLPYALALGVECQWSEQFARLLSSASVYDRHYQPTWYHGGLLIDFDSATFASELGSSLDIAVSTSSIAPSSSSGGSGGGFSGGGFGGGGGGGW